jgi:hypothetical protein
VKAIHISKSRGWELGFGEGWEDGDGELREEFRHDAIESVGNGLVGYDEEYDGICVDSGEMRDEVRDWWWRQYFG